MKGVQAHLMAHKTTRCWLKRFIKEEPEPSPRDLGFNDEELVLREELLKQRRLLDALLLYADASTAAMGSLLTAQEALAAAGVADFSVAAPTAAAFERRLYQGVGTLRQTIGGALMPRIDALRSAMVAAQDYVRQADASARERRRYKSKVDQLQAKAPPAGQEPQTNAERKARAQLERNEGKLVACDEEAKKNRAHAHDALKSCASRRDSLDELVGRVMDTVVEALGSSAARVPASSAAASARAAATRRGSSPNPFDEDDQDELVAAAEPKPTPAPSSSQPPPATAVEGFAYTNGAAGTPAYMNAAMFGTASPSVLRPGQPGLATIVGPQAAPAPGGSRAQPPRGSNPFDEDEGEKLTNVAATGNCVQDAGTGRLAGGPASRGTVVDNAAAWSPSGGAAPPSAGAASQAPVLTQVVTTAAPPAPPAGTQQAAVSNAVVVQATNNPFDMDI